MWWHSHVSLMRESLHLYTQHTLDTLDDPHFFKPEVDTVVNEPSCDEDEYKNDGEDQCGGEQVSDFNGSGPSTSRATVEEIVHVDDGESDEQHSLSESEGDGEVVPRQRKRNREFNKQDLQSNKKRAYAASIRPIHGPDEWPKVTTDLILPLKIKARPGRPMRARKRAADEPSLPARRVACKGYNEAGTSGVAETHKHLKKKKYKPRDVNKDGTGTSGASQDTSNVNQSIDKGKRYMEATTKARCTTGGSQPHVRT
ncbi:hypothetical protein CJ030_MR3G028962 [Morella rubra]|uniref:Uncharacterized protein n=1 Tax=Morella rubra TaxID=262757 RepID=A0A6A1W1T6_9ROSI|nr:hypothetical protein CJ030_MR3G028962 [Morella rubra]